MNKNNTKKEIRKPRDIESFKTRKNILERDVRKASKHRSSFLDYLDADDDVEITLEVGTK